MAWFKRNLIFVITCFVGVALAGYCGYLLLDTMSENTKASDAYAAAQSQLNELMGSKPFPDAANIAAAESDQVRVQEFLDQFRKPFSSFPVPPTLDDHQFNDYLKKTIAQFGTEATNSGVSLDAGYTFGFSSQQMDKLIYPAGCIEPWMQELEEMKAILHILYTAKINFLKKIRRPQVSPEDQAGDDFTKFATVTNQNAIVTPYQIEFLGFSKEIADVLAGIAASSNCLVVKTIYVNKSMVPLPELPQSAPPPAANQVYRRPPPRMQPEGFDPETGLRGRRQPFIPRREIPPPVYAQAEPAPTGPELILMEKPLFVTLYIDVVKLKASEVPASNATPKPRTAMR